MPNLIVSLFRHRLLRKSPQANGWHAGNGEVAGHQNAYDEDDFLLLDEPTRNLSVASSSCFAEALAAYRGTVINATHGRYLCEALWGVRLQFTLER